MKFDNVWYICPESSFVLKHPFKDHPKVIHELNCGVLEAIFKELSDLKKQEEESDDDVQYNCVIIDDFADVLKEKHIQVTLSKLLIKARHLRCAFVFTLQSYYYFPKILRKQISYISIWKPKNIEEWDSITSEILNMNKDNAIILYNYIFNQPYAHLDIDTVSNLYYKNFNLLEITE